MNKVAIVFFIRKNLLHPIIAFLEILFISKQKKVLICGRMGRTFADNPKFFFQYLIEENSNLEFNFYIRDKIKYSKLKKLYPNKIVNAYSLKGVWTYITSNTIIIGHGPDDVFPFVLNNKRKNVINLFHGIPLKRIGMKSTNKQIESLKKKNKTYNYFIVSSEEEKEAIQEDLLIEKDKLKIAGQPRNDFLFNKKSNENSIKFKEQANGKKVILYAPTFRDDGRDVIFFPFEGFNFDDFDSVLEKMNCVLFFRSHVNDYEKIKKRGSNLKNVQFANQKDYPDIQEILGCVDLLITDYSSVCLDFLIVNKPMLFFPYDYEQYEKERGFLFEYETAAVGKKISTLKDFYAELDSSINQPESDSERRKKQLNRFHSFQDGKSNERILKLIKDF